ncbi:MAG: response regulator [Candidatus Wallbacteria bacterium]|nr:response regulator [Candidatus Wallbacteria bacterium]
MARKVKLLAVDDNRAVLRILKDGLERESFDVRTAESGVEALEQILLEKPDVILLDIVMPGVTGYEVCRVLRSDPHTAPIPIIMVTASVPDKVRQESYEAGANDIWAKPINVMEIATSIRSYLEAGVKYEPVTEQKEGEILRSNLRKVVADFRGPYQAISTVAKLMGEGTKIEPKQVAEVLRQQCAAVQELLEKLERLSL